jgi:hypothetical protein
MLDNQEVERRIHFFQCEPELLFDLTENGRRKPLKGHSRRKAGGSGFLQLLPQFGAIPFFAFFGYEARQSCLIYERIV